jgi:hypothetical protein
LNRKGRKHTGAISEVKNTVLLEDRTQHGLNDDRRAWVRDERRLFMQLLSEEVDPQISVLAGGGRGGNADDLARTALKHQEIAHAYVMSGDGDGVGSVAGFGRGSTRCWLTTTTYLNVNFFPNITVMMMTMTSTDDAFSSTVKTMSEGVIVT